MYAPLEMEKLILGLKGGTRKENATSLKVHLIWWIRWISMCDILDYGFAIFSDRLN